MKVRLLSILIILFTYSGYGEELNRELWEKERQGKSYADEGDKETPEENEQENPFEERDESAPKQNFLNSLSLFKQILIALFFLGIIVAIIFIVMNNQQKISANKKLKPQALDIEIDHIEADLLDMDMKALIQDAEVKSEKQRELRLRYLWCIQLMDEKHLVVWQRDKTNTAYLREIKRSKYYNAFDYLTLKINEITYGEMEVSEDLFAHLRPMLIELNSQLQKHQKSE